MAACARRGFIRACVSLIDLGVSIQRFQADMFPFEVYNPLETAAENANADLVECFIDRSSVLDVEACSEALIGALKGLGRHGTADDFLRTVEILLRHGANPNAQDEKGRSALHYVATAYPPYVIPTSRSIFELLLDRGANPNLKDGCGETPFHLICQYSPESKGDLIKLLLDAGADPNILSTESKNSLYFAAGEYSEEPVKILLDSGALIEAGGYSALYAALRGYACPDSVRLLLASGAQIPYDGVETEAPISILLRRMSTSEEHNIEILQLLLERKVKIQAEDFKTASRPPGSNAKALELFFQHKHLLPEQDLPRILANTINTKWQMSSSNLSIKMLIDNGADATKRVERYGISSSLLHCICFDTTNDYIRYLVNKGVNVNSLDTAGCTPLHIAA
jgi:hypothetical protein